MQVILGYWLFLDLYQCVLTECPHRASSAFLLSSCRWSMLQSLTGLSASCPVCPSLTLCIKMSPTPHLSSTHVTSGPTSCRGTSLQTFCFHCYIITESTVSTVMIVQSVLVLSPRLYSIHNLTFRNILYRCLKFLQLSDVEKFQYWN